MKKLISFLFYMGVGGALAVFLVANRQPVSISLDPINVDDPAIATYPVPLWIWLMAALLIGFSLGAIGMWISARDKRLEANETKRAFAALQKENEILAARSSATPPTLVAEA
ncbi:MAG: LapA family protein [Pseudomonadota bacterium]